MLWLFLALFVGMAAAAMAWGKRRVDRLHGALAVVARKHRGRIERMTFGVPRLHLEQGKVPVRIGWIPAAGDEPEHMVAEFRTMAPLAFPWTLQSTEVANDPGPPEGQVEIPLGGRLGHRYRAFAPPRHRQDARALIEGPLRDPLLSWSRRPRIAIRAGTWTNRPRSWKHPPDDGRGTPVEITVPSAITDSVRLEQFAGFSRTVSEILGG